MILVKDFAEKGYILILSQKMKEYRAEKGWTQEDLSKFSGVSLPSIKRYEAGSENITTTNLKKIATALGVEVANFMSPNMVKSVSQHVSQNKKVSPNNQNSVSQSEKMKKLDEIASGNKNKIINLRFFDNVSAAAGYGANNDDESFEIIEVTAKFLSKILRVIPQEYDVISVLGDSMEPLVKNGDMVLVKPTSEASNGEIVIANLGGDLYVKKLLRDPIKRNVRLTSMNNFYEDIVIEEDELEQLNIVGVVKKVMSSNIIAT